MNLSPEEKKLVGKPSMPRPEIDLLAFRPRDNTVVLMEVKSYLDSLGVQLKALKKQTTIPEGRYKLFTCGGYFQTVLDRLKRDLKEAGLIDGNTRFKLGLAAGKIHKNEAAEMMELFNSKGWLLWTPDMIRSRTEALATIGYENDPFVMTAKVLINGNTRKQQA